MSNDRRKVQEGWGLPELQPRGRVPAGSVRAGRALRPAALG